MQLFFLAFLINPLIILFLTNLVPSIFGKLYKSTIFFGLIITFLWVIFAFFGIDIDLFFTFDGKYYYERLINCLNFNYCEVEVTVRDIGYDLIIQYWYRFISFIGLISPVNYSNFYLFLQLNVLVSIFTINLILDIKNKYINTFFDKNNIFLITCPLFIAFALQLDREIFIALITALIVKFLIEKNFIFLAFSLILLIPLRPTFFILLAISLIIYIFFRLLRRIVQTKNISLKSFLPVISILLIVSISLFLFEREYILNYFILNSNSGINLLIANQPFLLRAPIYAFLSIFTPLIDFQALTKPDPINFIISFTGLWNLTLILYLFLNRFKFEISRFIKKDFVYLLVLTLILCIFVYKCILFNVRHSVQFYPLIFLIIYLFSFDNFKNDSDQILNKKLSQKSLVNAFLISLAFEIPLSLLI